jgi:integrase/recombinase XerD
LRSRVIRNVAISDWPECDRRAWNTALEPGAILDNPGALSHLGTHSVTALKYSYGRWLRYLLCQNRFDPNRSGTELLSPDLFRAYVTSLGSTLAPISVAYSVSLLGRLARLFQPETDWSFVQATGRKLFRNAQPVRNNRARCRPLIELYELGFKLMEKAETRSSPIHRAREFRNGLIISFLAARPLRIRNLAMIALNRHLQLRGENYWIHFEPDETKNRRSLDLRWPEPLQSALIRYMKIYRPVLVGTILKQPNPGDYLWVICRSQGLYKIIKNRTAQRFGQPMNPQLFRHAAATSTAIEDPAHVGIVTTILGHSSFRITEAYYNMATSIDAARRYQKHIVRLRRTGSRR